MITAKKENRIIPTYVPKKANDLPMFSMAKHKVCMSNGMEELKIQADFITDTVLNDGIEKALLHYHLI